MDTGNPDSFFFADIIEKISVRKLPVTKQKNIITRCRIQNQSESLAGSINFQIITPIRMDSGSEIKLSSQNFRTPLLLKEMLCFIWIKNRGNGLLWFFFSFYWLLIINVKWMLSVKFFRGRVKFIHVSNYIVIVRDGVVRKAEGVKNKFKREIKNYSCRHTKISLSLRFIKQLIHSDIHWFRAVSFLSAVPSHSTDYRNTTSFAKCQYRE